jgi:hypothetical protein
VEQHQDENLGTKKNPVKSYIYKLLNDPRIPKLISDYYPPNPAIHTWIIELIFFLLIDLFI